MSLAAQSHPHKMCVCAITGGAFVVQLPDCLTTFTVSMVYLLMRSFTGLSLVKPFTSCAATGARFLVCLGRLDDGNVGALWLTEVRHWALAENIWDTPYTLTSPMSLDAYGGCSQHAMQLHTRSHQCDYSVAMCPKHSRVTFAMQCMHVQSTCNRNFEPAQTRQHILPEAGSRPSLRFSQCTI